MALLSLLTLICGSKYATQNSTSCLQTNITQNDELPVSLNLEPGNQVPFNITTNVSLEHEAYCFTLAYDFVGVDEGIATTFELPKGKLEGTLSKTKTWKLF